MILRELFLAVTLILTMLPSIVHSQQGSIENIGFAYGVYAARSPIFSQAEELFKSKNYDSIQLLLESSSTADQLVGATLCTQLQEDEKITLTDSQKQRILDIENSSEMIKFRYGCTCNEVISLSDYFSGKNPCDFRVYMRRWKKRLAERYY